jgi:hypothetical protein
MNRAAEKSLAPVPRPNANFFAAVTITALVAAVSTALCIRIGIPVWGMFAGWIVFVTGGGSAKAGFAALGSALIGILLGIGGALAIAASSAGLGGIAVPAVVFVIVAIAVICQRVPFFNSVIGYFIGMTVYFASALPPTSATFIALGSAVALGMLSGLLATILGRTAASALER